MTTSTSTSSGYRACSCPDCFEIALGRPMPAIEFCSDCEEAGCDGEDACQCDDVDSDEVKAEKLAAAEAAHAKLIEASDLLISVARKLRELGYLDVAKQVHTQGVRVDSAAVDLSIVALGAGEEV